MLRYGVRFPAGPQELLTQFDMNFLFSNLCIDNEGKLLLSNTSEVRIVYGFWLSSDNEIKTLTYIAPTNTKPYEQ